MKSVTLAIASYNSEKNIESLLYSISNQKQSNWKLKKIIVHADACSDNTVTIVKKNQNKSIVLIDNKKRKGFAGSVNTLLRKSDADITILLNDDIKITDISFVSKIVKRFNSNKKIGLLTVRPVPLTPRTFIERSVISTIRAYESALYDTGKYQNLFTCDGKVLAFSMSFKNSIKFPKNLNEVGNVDSYIYLSCIKNRFQYWHEKNLEVYFRCPSTLKDWIRWTSRNNADKMILMPTFGPLVEEEFTFPDTARLSKNKWLQLMRQPMESTVAFFVGIYAQKKAKSHSKWLTSTWETVTTSKVISV